jgi:hypothetical protein
MIAMQAGKLYRCRHWYSVPCLGAVVLGAASPWLCRVVCGLLYALSLPPCGASGFGPSC